MTIFFFFFFQAEDGIRDGTVTGVQTCALPISAGSAAACLHAGPARRAGAATAASDRASHHRRAVGALRSGGSPARAGHQPMERPPSTARIWPVTYGAPVAKNRHARATS